jgi:hypothetical protein
MKDPLEKKFLFPYIELPEEIIVSDISSMIDVKAIWK